MYDIFKIDKNFFSISNKLKPKLFLKVIHLIIIIAVVIAATNYLHLLIWLEISMYQDRFSNLSLKIETDISNNIFIEFMKNKFLK